MTNAEWIAQAKERADVLRDFLSKWHPVNLTGKERILTDVPLPITAPGAEAACAVVRDDIRRNSEGDPVTDFNAALEAGDVQTVYKLLDHAWFGVPESTNCWKIPGFREAVDLIESAPDNDAEDRDGDPDE